jgi:adenylyltransferase/sulfurtransferase
VFFSIVVRMSDLLPDPQSRHHRQMILPGFGVSAQARLADARALVVGCGALGCVAIDLLARAGVGALTLVDRDVVEMTNLQRQSLYVDADARGGVPKAEAAKRRVQAIDPNVRVHACVEHMSAENVEEFVRDCDVIIDGLDNYRTRYILNDAAVKFGKAFVHAGAVAMRGTSMPILAGVAGALGISKADAPCLRCVFPEVPAPGEGETCDTAGVFGPAVAMVGAYAAGQAIKLLAGRADLLDCSFWSMECDANRIVRIPLAGSARADCVCCGARRFEFLEAESEGRCTVLCGRNAVQVRPASVARIDLARLQLRLASVGTFVMTDGLLVGSPEGSMELSVFPDGRAIVRGTTDPVAAQVIYDRYVGQ